MQRNYDTTLGLPYPRISKVEIVLDEEGNGSAIYTEKLAVALPAEDGGKRVHYLESTEARHRIDIAASDMAKPVPTFHPVTGQQLPGTTSGQQLYMAALGIIRADQLARDAASA